MISHATLAITDIGAHDAGKPVIGTSGQQSDRLEERMNFQTEDGNASQPMQVTCSGILRKDGKKIIYVRFERGADFAEGSIPAAKITSQSGFSPDEIAQLEEYLSENKFEIIEQAKTVNLMKNFMK